MNEMSRCYNSCNRNYDVNLLSTGTDFTIIKGALRDVEMRNNHENETDDRVPICLLRHIDEGVNLQTSNERE